MLGNDVVDLRDADSRPETFRPRFDARVFTPEERRSISRDRNALVRRWAHWAAKEAAFKSIKQGDPDFIFSPSRLSVEFEPARTEGCRAIVRHGSVRFTGAPRDAYSEVAIRSFETDEHVHVVALSPEVDWDSVEFAVEPLEASEMDPSAAVRELAVREISRSLGIAQHRLRIGQRPRKHCESKAERSFDGRVATTPSRVPTVELDEVETSLSLSLSHHGRFISYAMTPRVEVAIRGSRRRELGEGFAGAGAGNS